MLPQTTTTMQRAMNTAAEPWSLALPESSWRSVPIRSTTASTALFNRSTAITSKTDEIISAISILVSPSQNASGIRMHARKHSWRNAVSFLNALFKPCKEYFVELIQWVNPVVLYIKVPML